MSEYNLLLTCSGWEDRFIEGLNNNISNHQVDRIVVFNINEFLGRTEKNRAVLHQRFVAHNITEMEVSLLDDVKTWWALENFFKENEIEEKKLMVDITTMPRFLIWFLMHFINRHNNKANYIYYKPNKYEQCSWLTSEAEKPRLVFKHSGISLSDRPTILIIQTGFDIERVYQMIYSYEPKKVFLGAQVGDQFDNMSNNLKKHKEHLQFQEIEYFEMDAFNSPYGNDEIKEIIEKNHDSHNIILSSFGPKPSAVAMFNLSMEFPNVGLSYVIVKSYNDSYSHGINIEDQIFI